METLPDSSPLLPPEKPGWKGTVWCPSTNSSLQISIVQIQQIFNISYFSQFNLFNISFPKCPQITQKFTQNHQTVVNEINREINSTALKVTEILTERPSKQPLRLPQPKVYVRPKEIFENIWNGCTSLLCDLIH